MVKCLPENRDFDGKYTSFKNIKFLRATIRPIALRYKHSTVTIFIVHHHSIASFRKPVQKSYWIIFKIFQMEGVKAKYIIWKKK